MPFYAVKVGTNPGIYSSWTECEQQVKGFPNAKYKKFDDRLEAYDFIIRLERPAQSSITPSKEVVQKIQISNKKRELQTETKTFSATDSSKDETKRKRLCLENTSTSEPKSSDKNAAADNKISFSFNGENVSVYTDGACSNNGQEKASAGVGVYWGRNHPLNVSRKLEGAQTNNRAEITAAIIAIEQAITHKAGMLTVYTDSKFMISCIESWIKNWKSNGWKTSKNEPVKNIDDLKQLDLLCAKISVKWEYVPGHKGVAGNEEADRLARSAVLK